MLESLPTGLLLRLMNATPEQLAAVERVLGECPDRAISGSQGSGSDLQFLFTRCGDHWKVVFDGRELHVADSLGAKYLDYLLHRPNRPIPAFDLEIAVIPEKRAARLANSRDAVSDDKGLRQCLREMERLRGEREVAQANGNAGLTEEIDDELERLEQRIKQHNGSSDTGERSRNNVRKAIAAVTRGLLRGDQTQKAFAAHIRQFVDTGYACAYHQPLATEWK